MGQTKVKTIGIFDSGIGGFSILKEIHQIAPQLNVFYVADEQYAPYGEKKKSEIIERSKLIVDELLKQSVDLIVVACNTATAMAIDELRKCYSIPFVGVEPFVNALSKLEWQSDDKACVITTELMSTSARFQGLKDRYDSDKKLDYFVTKNLAALIEKFYADQDEQSLERSLVSEFSFLDTKSYTHIILGCTHYPLIGQQISKVTGLETLSPCSFVADRVFDLLKDDLVKNSSPKSSFQFSKTNGPFPLCFVSKGFAQLP
ncbi:glutamate racemase [Halobacteriovorax marinus]|uniref:Glutamate racemase n=1 Tax=Halobacteriovorax marinus TaxID=97084 RepID=A0A1Y5F8U3_9BACT|nr:glutamate racemase [Halobacteriovorax marinus]